MPGQATRPEPTFHWFMPIDGDGEHIGTARAERPPTFDYLRSVATTVENAGFRAVLVPIRFSNGLFREDAPLAETWTTATALAATTTKLQFLIAARPGYVATGLYANQVATLSRQSGGRIHLNVVPGGIQGDNERLGEEADHNARYERAIEFIEACRALWHSDGVPVTYDGKHVQLRGAICSPGPEPPGPLIYTGGASPQSLSLAGSHADVLLSWIQPLDVLGPHLDRAREHFRRFDRTPSFGLRTHLVVRDTEEAAWDAAAELLSQADAVVQEQRHAAVAGTSMVGHAAQAVRVEDDRVGPHLWNGISRVRVNCGTAIVGTPEQVAGELLAYWKLGIDEFILSGYPHVEEAGRVASDVIPLVRSLVGES